MKSAILWLLPLLAWACTSGAPLPCTEESAASVSRCAAVVTLRSIDDFNARCGGFVESLEHFLVAVGDVVRRALQRQQESELLVGVFVADADH